MRLSNLALVHLHSFVLIPKLLQENQMIRKGERESSCVPIKLTEKQELQEVVVAKAELPKKKERDCLLQKKTTF